MSTLGRGPVPGAKDWDEKEGYRATSAELRDEMNIDIEALCAAPPEVLSNPQPEPNATELPSYAPVLARAAQRRRRRRRRLWWRGEEGARRPGPEGQVLRHVLRNAPRNALRRVLHVLILHVSPKGRHWGGVAARRSIPFFIAP